MLSVLDLSADDNVGCREIRTPVQWKPDLNYIWMGMDFLNVELQKNPQIAVV